MSKQLTGNPTGRPPKSKVKPKRAVGRPKGEAAIMADFRNRMLASPKSSEVLQAVFRAALDDNHKNQAAAWKLIIDRVAPLSGFEKMAGSAPRAAIQVNISGVPGVQVTTGPVEQPIDTEWEEVSES